MLNGELKQGINLMLKGEESGFNMFYSQSFEYVYTRAKEFMLNDTDAIQLTRETFVQVYKDIYTLDHVKNAYAWLCGITFRKGMKMFQQQNKLGDSNRSKINNIEAGYAIDKGSTSTCELYESQILSEETVAQSVYNAACIELGLTPTTLFTSMR